jgi:plasmid stabilization system protein ParE
VIATILDDAEDDLERAFDYYQQRQAGLGADLVEEFRRGVDLILAHPHGWQPLDETYRRYRLHRFPYGIVYRVDARATELVIVALMHLSEQPGKWRGRDRAGGNDA